MYFALKFFAVFMGLGSLFYVSGRSFLGWRRSHLPSTACAAGLILNLIFAMLTSHIVGAILAQIILALGLWLAQRRHPPILAPKLTQPKSHLMLAGLVLLALGFLMLCLVEPIKDWDARSMWFYHAKVIYHMQSIWAGGAWADQANIYTHLNYPKLFPLLAAEVATLLGFWNEFAPKMAIALLALPLLSFYVEAWQWDANHKLGSALKIAMLTLLLFGFDGSGFFLFNGYMDGWIALYTCLAVLAWAQNRNQWQAIVFLCLLTEIKQEGLMVGAIVLIIATLLDAKRWRNIFKGETWNKLRPQLMRGFVLIAPVFVWLIAVKIQGLSRNHFGGNTLERMITRLANPSDCIWIVANILLHNAIVLPALLLSVFLSVLIFRNNIQMPLIMALPSVAALAYSAVIFCVYLATNADLHWHIGASAGRVGLTTGLLFSTFNMLAIQELVPSKRRASSSRPNFL